MSNRQVFDTVDTPARNRQNWPSPDAFHYPDEILKWRDIPTGIFKILDKFDRGESEYGKSLIVKLESFSGPFLLVWAPRSVIFALEQDEDAKFIQNLGFKVDANGKKYYDFKLC